VVDEVFWDAGELAEEIMEKLLFLFC